MIGVQSYSSHARNAAAVVVLCLQMVFYLLISEEQAYRLIVAPPLSKLTDQHVSAEQLAAQDTKMGATPSAGTMEKWMLSVFPPTTSIARCMAPPQDSAPPNCSMLISAVGVDAVRAAVVYGLLSYSQLLVALLSTSACWLVTRPSKHSSLGSTRIPSLNRRKAVGVAGVLVFLAIGAWQLITSLSASSILQMADRVLPAETFGDAVRTSNQSFWASAGMILVALIFAWEVAVLAARDAKSHS